MIHAALVLALAASPAPDAPGVLAEVELAQQDLFAALAPSVVFIATSKGLGSGFFVGANGLVLTNNHVVEKADDPQIVLFDGRKLTGHVVERATGDIDLALLQVDLKDAPVPTLDRGDDLRIGSWVAAVGHGKGVIWTFNTGMISNIHPSGSEYPIIQTQIPLNPGASGGPIVDRRGRVVGIVVSGILDSNSINFAYKLEVAFSHLAGLVSRCDCLAITAPAGVPVFLDGTLVGKGPRVTARPTAGEHEVFAVIQGRMSKRKVSYPAQHSAALE